MNPTSQTPPHTTWNRKDWGICLVLGLLALTLYCSGRNQEIQGDDDYLYVANFSMITDAILGFHPGSLRGFASSASNLAAQILCAPRHAPLPAVIHALFYALCHGLHIPFSMDLLHLPTGAIGAASVSLLYWLLRKTQKASRLLCATGTLLLLLSPIFTMVSRGLGAYFLAFIPLTTLVALWGLNSLANGVAPRWWMGLFLAQVVVSDVIWFITLPVLLAAFVWGSRDRRLASKQLGSIKVIVPVALTVTLLLAGTWVAFHKGLSTPLSKLLTEHGTKVIHGSPVFASPAYLGECLSVLLGVAFPCLLPLGAIVWWTTGKPRAPALMTAFSLTGLVIYGAVFYGLTPERTFVKLCYQTYLLVPFVLIVVALLMRLASTFRWGPLCAATTLSILLIFEGLACVNFIWKIPVSPASSIFTEWAHGTVSPNRGTKAAGYLARQWIEATWRMNPRQPITLYAGRYNTSFAIFSGLNAGEKGWTFIPEFGPDRPITAMSAPALVTFHRETDPSLPMMVYVFDFAETRLPTTLDIASLIQGQSRLLCYTIRSSSPNNRTAIVYVRPPPGNIDPPIPPGEVNMEDCESRFDRTYNRYDDFFPRRLAP